MRKVAKILAAATLAVAAPAFAQQTGPGTAGSGVGNGAVDLSYGNPGPEEEDDGFPWGLLGLLGLAGLLPRKRRDRVDAGSPRG